MKRFLSILVLFSLVLGSTACGSNNDKKEEKTEEEVAAFFEKEGFEADYTEEDDSFTLSYSSKEHEAVFYVIGEDGDNAYLYRTLQGIYFLKDESNVYGDERVATSDFLCLYDLKDEKSASDDECSKAQIKEAKETKDSFDKWTDKHGLTAKAIIKHLDKVIEDENDDDSKGDKKSSKLKLTTDEESKLDEIFNTLNTSISGLELIGKEKVENTYNEGKVLTQYEITFTSNNASSSGEFKLTLTKDFNHRGLSYKVTNEPVYTDVYHFVEVSEIVFPIDKATILLDLPLEVKGGDWNILEQYGDMNVYISSSLKSFRMTDMSVVNSEE